MPIIDLGMISLAKAAADPAGHYARPDVTRLVLDKTPGDRVVLANRRGKEIGGAAKGAPLLRTSEDEAPALRRAA